MTVGEKIQHHRKLRGLSQEELGQRLLVSRQTISLWENDQTLPTIDNLIRLKEIFGVSVDELLCEHTQEKTTPEPQYRERYTCTFSFEEMAQMEKEILRPDRIRVILLPILCALLAIVFFVADAPPFISGSIVGLVFFYTIWMLRGIKQYRTAWRKSQGRVVGAEYIYDVYDGYFHLQVYQNGSQRSAQWVPFSEIENVRCIGSVIMFQAFGQLFLMREIAIREDSLLRVVLANPAVKQIGKPKRDKRQIWSIALFVATLLSLHAALIGVAVLSETNKMFVENTWVFFLFLPIPVASIVLGYALKARGYKWKKNVIAGFIVAVLMVIYGCFTFIFSGMYDHSDAYISTIESYTHIDLPRHSHISTMRWPDEEQSGRQGHIYYSCEIYFDEAEAEQFEASLDKDVRWRAELKNEMVGLLSSWYSYVDGAYVSLYNVHENKFNTVPSTNGTYRFLSLFYDPKQNVMYVVEYDIDYVK